MDEYDTTTIIGKIEAAIAFSKRGMPQSSSRLLAQVEIEIEQLQAENKEIKMLLGRYGRHDPKCESLMNDKVCPCTCGYDEIIA